MLVLSEWGRGADERGWNFELSGPVRRAVKEFCPIAPAE
jgi:hypothetical protein